MKAAERALATVYVEGDEPANHSHYEEYVRGFDDIPVLNDAVRIPPRHAPSPNFVHGERRSLRKQERPDGYAQREASVAELEQLYSEYLAPQPVKRKRKPRAKKAGTAGTRKRKASAAPGQ